MICPECDSVISDIAEHIKLCPLDPIRLLNIGLINKEEYENIFKKVHCGVRN